MRSRRWLIAAVVAVAALLVAGRAVAGWYVDYRWYESLGAADVWRTRAWNLFLLRGVTFVLGTLFVFANLYAVRSSVVSLVLPRRVANLEIGEEVPSRYLLAVVLIVSVVIGGLLALPHDDWMSLELLRHGDAFGETDPYFQFDISFWLYWLPLESALHLWSLIALLSITLVVVFLYALTPSLRWDGGRLRVSGYVRRHLFALGAVLLLLLAWSYRLDAYSLLNSGSGAMGAFTAVDHRVGIPSNLILAVITVAAAMLVVWSGWVGQIRLAFASVTVVLLLALTLRQVVPPVAQRFVTPADPEQRERPYQATRNGYTRRAYDVDRLTRDDPAAPPAPALALRGAALWDTPALSRAVSRDARSATSSALLGWDIADGRPVAVRITPPTGPDAADPLAPWGIFRYAGDLADQRGAPVERTDLAEIDASVARSVLVFDSVSSYVVLNDSSGRIAATDLSSLGTRVAHAWHLQNLRFLGSEVPSRGRIVLRRAVRARVRALYPFFEQSPTVSPIAWRDSLYWAVHLYAVSEWYPLSDPVSFANRDAHFVRHAATALVNAHTGRVTAIPDPAPDPVTASWMRTFPMLFAAEGAVDPDLTRRLPPAVDALLIQARAFAQVGVRGEFLPPSHLPKRGGGDTLFTVEQTAPYVDAVSGELALAFPILDATDRLRGVVTADGGAAYEPHWRPVTTAGPRWSYVLERMQRIPDTVAARMARDTHPLHGAVRVVPADGGVAFLQTRYGARADGAVQLQSVSVLVGDSVGVGQTIPSAVGAPSPPPTLEPLTPEEFRARVEERYAEMRDALRRGDLRAFGEAYDALGRLLRAPTR